MNTQPTDQVQTTQAKNSKNESTGKVFFFTGLALLVINGILALALGKALILMTILPVSIVFIAVGAGLWMQARKARMNP